MLANMANAEGHKIRKKSESYGKIMNFKGIPLIESSI
jgi:hypothetical protein